MILFVGFDGQTCTCRQSPVERAKERYDEIAAAGPASNIILAIFGGLILRFLNGTGLITDTILILIIYFTRINIALAVFNLIPISPLDGSQIFSNYLLKYNPELAWKLQAYGPQVLFGLILLAILLDFP